MNVCEEKEIDPLIDSFDDASQTKVMTYGLGIIAIELVPPGLCIALIVALYQQRKKVIANNHIRLERLFYGRDTFQ